MDQEPSVLDYLKSKLMPWKGEAIEIPQDDHLLEEIDGNENPQVELALPVHAPTSNLRLPWRSIVSLILAIAAQSSFEPRPDRTWLPGVILYAASAIIGLWAVLKDELRLAAHLNPERETGDEAETPVRLGKWGLLGIAGLLFILAILLFGNKATGEYKFNSLNILVWAITLIAMTLALYMPQSGRQPGVKRLWGTLIKKEWTIRFSWWSLLVLAVLALGIFFRFYQLNEVPSEMVSDHAEKLLDVQDILRGDLYTYFPRNTGREFFQFYWTALMVILFGQGISFLSLKLGTVILGVLTLPFIYLIGEELGSKRVGLLATAFAGFAYWPNLISRIALRFTLYPFFYAPTLFFFLRGMRKMRRSDFILSGFFLGLGLHGYSPSRMVPILLVFALILFLMHPSSRLIKKQAVFGLIVVALISLVVFLPLLRYTIDNPDIVGYRSLTRLGSLEQPIQDNPVKIFFTNLWRAMTMFAWDNGEVWVISLTHRPVLDVISGALYHLGAFLMFIRYLRKRHWIDLFMLISIIILMLPSILSIAFPAENPSLNRTAAAIIPVFIIVGYGMDAIMTALERAGKSGRWWAWAGAILLVLFSSMQNFDMVFNQYKQVYNVSSWNTSDMGKVARAFSDSVGSPDTTYLVAYPYWADSRLIGIESGYPYKDYALWPDQFDATKNDPRAKMFIINPNDVVDTEALQKLYPDGVLYYYDVPIEGKDFWLFYTPPEPVRP